MIELLNSMGHLFSVFAVILAGIAVIGTLVELINKRRRK